MEKHANKKKVAVVVTIPMQIRFFLVNHIEMLSRKYEVSVILKCSDDRHLLDVLPDSVHIFDIPFVRKISVISDVRALILLIRLFYRKKFDFVYSVSPKAGLLTMIASWLLRIPIRLHTFTGQVWVNKKGLMKWLLKSMDHVIASLSTISLVDSPSQRDFLISNNVISEKKSIVIGKGSISGVDAKRFCPRKEARNWVREMEGIGRDAVVFLFVGRLTVDKGVIDLARSFSIASKCESNLSLWFVGPDEGDLKEDILAIIPESEKSVRFLPYTTAPEYYMASADVLCLPSYREGFGSVIIEAAACEVPAIGTKIYGITDAIEDGKTGVLVEKCDVHALAHAMCELIRDFSLRKRLGRMARKRVLDHFEQQLITEKMLSLIAGQ